MKDSISFVVYANPTPQGSSRAFVVNGRAVITSANKKLKPYRQEVAGAALVERGRTNYVMAGKHIPVEAIFKFYFERPPSIPKKRVRHVVKPDLSKLVRATEDALTGILYADDAQIISFGDTAKYYGSPARVEITVRIAQDASAPATVSKEAGQCLLTSE